MRPLARYCAARFRREQEAEAWRAYLSEQVTLSVQGRYMGRSFAQLLADSRRPRDPRTGDETAADVISRLGLEVV